MKNTLRHLNGRAAAFLCASGMLLCSLSGVLLHASAENTDGSLTVWCATDDRTITGMHWSIYKVGERNGNDFVFEGDFADYHVTLGDRSVSMNTWDAKTVAAAAETLRVYTVVDHIPARDDGETGADGSLVFDGLEDGLYLVAGDLLVQGQYTYMPSAIFFEMRGGEDADLDAFPKIEYNTLSDREAHYTIHKVWQNDEDQPWNRDAFIEVALYCDGEYVRKVRLDESNNWLYEWDASSAEEWHCVEVVIPDDYTVIYRENLTQYLIVNTYEEPIDDSSKTDIQTATTPETTMDHDRSTTDMTDDGTRMTGTTTEDEARNTTERTEPDTSAPPAGTTASTTTTTVPPAAPPPGDTPGGKLPQTGQLWWPVPVMGLGGLLLIGAGLTLRRKENEES